MNLICGNFVFSRTKGTKPILILSLKLFELTSINQPVNYDVLKYYEKLGFACLSCQGATSVSGYFPNTRWYRYRDVSGSILHLIIIYLLMILLIESCIDVLETD